MLKKTGTVVALATAGLLAMSPLAFAGNHGNVDVTDQENQQQSAQGNGLLNGNNLVSGNAVQVCNVSANALNNVVGALIAIASPVTIGQISNVSQGSGDCTNEGKAVGQKTIQDAENENGSND